MKIRIKWLFNSLISLFILVGISCASANTPADLTNLLNATNSMQANFSQVVYDSRGKVLQRANGYMAMERPGKFRWEVMKPIPQVIIANQSRLWIYDPDLEQVTIRSLKTTAGETPALLLSHVNNVLDRDYVIKPGKSQQGWSWYTLIPRNADNMFASIQLGFRHAAIQQMRLQDHLGHMTLITFEDAVINTTLSASLFIFKKHGNVDVIDETRKR